MNPTWPLPWQRLHRRLVATLSLLIVLLVSAAWGAWAVMIDRERSTQIASEVTNALAQAVALSLNRGWVDEGATPFPPLLIWQGLPPVDSQSVPLAPPWPVELSGVTEIEAWEKGEQRGVTLLLSDGRLLSAILALPAPPAGREQWGWALLALVVIAVGSGALAYWVVWRSIAPMIAALLQLDTAEQRNPRAQPADDATSATVAWLQRQIDALVRERAVMIAGIAHDLRTPLTRLRLRCEVLPDGAERAGIERDLDELTHLAEQANAYLHSLTPSLKPEQRDLAAWLHERFADRREVLLDLPASAPLVTDYALLARLLDNLEMNALAHGRHLWLTVTAEAEGWRVVVDDDGPGIPADAREAVLAPFVRLDAERSRERGHGVGLGLAIVRNLAARLGDGVTLAESPRGGLRVLIRLRPLVSSQRNGD